MRQKGEGGHTEMLKFSSATVNRRLFAPSLGSDGDYCRIVVLKSQ